MIITITGTPGAGKTYFAKKLAKLLRFKHIELNKIIKSNKWYDSYDKKDKTFDVDVKKLKKNLRVLIDKKYKNKKIIIDSHLSHFIKADICFVVKTDLKTLRKRLEARKYSEKKIRDNLEAEIFDVCYEEAKDLNKNVLIVNN